MSDDKVNAEEIFGLPPLTDLEIGEFKPCVYTVANMGLTIMQLADVSIVWQPWGPFKGHAVDLGYDYDGNLVGIQIWDDVARLKRAPK